MSSRTTRNTSKNVQPAPSPTPPVQVSPAKARKSFTSRARAAASIPASVPSTSQSTSQAGTAQRTGGGPSTKKLAKRVRSSSSDSSAAQATTSQLMRGRSSSDSEDDAQPLSSISKSKKKQTPKRTQGNDSSSEGSDVAYTPPARGTVKSKQSISAPSGSRSPSLNDRGRAKVTKLDTPQVSGVKDSPSKQTGYLKNLINKCVFYILVADQKKHAIKKADILKNVFEDQSAKETYSTVLFEANKILKKTFGLEMLQLKNQKNSYIIINILDPDHGIQEFAEYSEDESQKRGLTFLLLTIIFMNQNAISEDKMWKALEPLGINPSSSAPHPVFGNVRRYITSELVKEMYLEYTRVNKDPIKYEFTWGERAYQEVQKKDLLEFACNIMGDSKPEDWKLQFIDAKPKPANSEA